VVSEHLTITGFDSRVYLGAARAQAAAMRANGQKNQSRHTVLGGTTIDVRIQDSHTYIKVEAGRNNVMFFVTAWDGDYIHVYATPDIGKTPTYVGSCVVMNKTFVSPQRAIYVDGNVLLSRVGSGYVSVSMRHKTVTLVELPTTVDLQSCVDLFPFPLAKRGDGAGVCAVILDSLAHNYTVHTFSGSPLIEYAVYTTPPSTYTDVPVTGDTLQGTSTSVTEGSRVIDSDTYVHTYFSGHVVQRGVIALVGTHEVVKQTWNTTGSITYVGTLRVLSWQTVYKYVATRRVVSMVSVDYGHTWLATPEILPNGTPLPAMQEAESDTTTGGDFVPVTENITLNPATSGYNIVVPQTNVGGGGKVGYFAQRSGLVGNVLGASMFLTESGALFRQTTYTNSSFSPSFAFLGDAEWAAIRYDTTAVALLSSDDGGSWIPTVLPISAGIPQYGAYFSDKWTGGKNYPVCAWVVPTGQTPSMGGTLPAYVFIKGAWELAWSLPVPVDRASSNRVSSPLLAVEMQDLI
jgi:hypothetical protein